MFRSRSILGLATACLLAACETPAPMNDVPTVDTGVTIDMPTRDMPTVDMPTVDMPTVDSPNPVQEAGADVVNDTFVADVPTDVPNPPPACMPGATEFQPRSMMARQAPWNMCMATVPDANQWVLFGASTSASGRVSGLDVLDRPGALFDPTRDPAGAEFTAADMIFQMNGVAVRFQRRADEHFVPMGNPPLNAAYQDFCTVPANQMANRDYCASPVSLNPVYTAAIPAGMAGMGPGNRIHAARLAAAYYWWLYLSVYKESLTCAPVIGDCDSAWGYFTGGAARDAATQFGLAKALLALGAPGRAAYDRIWDALLAVHCWRDQDGGRAMPVVEAANAMLREQARTQLEVALTRGMALLISARLRSFASTEGMAPRAAERAAHAAWIGVVGPLMARALETWVPTRYPRSDAAVRMRALTALRTGEMITSAAATQTAADLEAIFPCP